MPPRPFVLRSWRRCRPVWCWASSSSVGAAPTGAQVSAGPPLRAAPPGVSHQADALAFFPRVTTITAGQSVTLTLKRVPHGHLREPEGPSRWSCRRTGCSRRRRMTGQPLWWVGKAPLLGLNPKSFPQIGGWSISSPSQVASSGLQRVFTATPKHPPKPYTLTFAKPGLYRFFCIVHPGMAGAVRVLRGNGDRALARPARPPHEDATGPHDQQPQEHPVAEPDPPSHCLGRRGQARRLGGHVVLPEATDGQAGRHGQVRLARPDRHPHGHIRAIGVHDPDREHLRLAEGDQPVRGLPERAAGLPVRACEL